MIAKDYLGQAYRLDQRINSKLEQIQSLNELATKCTSTLTDMPHSATPNIRSMEQTIAKMVDLKAEINSDIDRLVDLKHDIVSTIKAVNNTEHQTLLELRYLCFKTWEQIAVTMGYGIDNIFKMHKKVLAQIVVPVSLQ